MAWHADDLIASAGGDYATLALFEAAYDGIDISATDGVRARCKGDITTGNTYWAGWQAGQDANCVIRVEPDQSSYAPDGINDAAGDDANIDNYQLISESTNPLCFDIRQIEMDGVGNWWFGGDGATNIIWITKCVFRDIIGNSAIRVYSCGTTTFYVGGCLFHSMTENYDNGISIEDADVTAHIFNCTFADITGNGAYGIDALAGATVTAKNCAEVDCAGDWFNVDTETTCKSENDATLTGNDADDFTAPSTEDYRVYDTNSALYETGTAIADGWFTTRCPTDFAGTSWKATPAVGCFEYVAAGGEEFTKDLSDTINLSDTRITNFGLPKVDNISLTDGIIKNFGVSKADAISLSEGIAKNVGMSKVDIISLSEEAIKNVGIPKTDAISLSDNFSSVVAFLRSLNDTITLSDGVTKSFGTTKTDIISITDDLTDMIRAILMSLNDTINLSDNIIKNISVVKGDIINISDDFSRVVVYLRALDDTILISDSESLEVRLNKSDAITLSDIFAKEDLVIIIITAPEGRSIIVAVENRYVIVEAEDRFTTVIAN